MPAGSLTPSVPDLEIARSAKLLPIARLAGERLGIPEESLELYGKYKAKLSLDYIESLKDRPDGKLILVTAMTPTPAGEGKTTTTVGLGDALNRISRPAVICLREPSLAPVFGMKGGAAGGGYAQVAPMEEINLHFTGDFAAVALANNLLAALVDNHIYHGNDLGLDVRRITWKRVLDVNDRALRQMTVGLGGPGNGYPREDGFDVAPASEVMAILCLSRTLEELRRRLGDILVGYTRARMPVTARDLKAHGAMAALLKTAFAPNLVQTLENNPAFVHGGPFANIAHGCNSALATQTALKLADFVVTEAGFGADLGVEKFVDIKCRKMGLRPSVVVVVATVRALKYQGGAELRDLDRENPRALEAGIPNLERHVDNIQGVFGLPCVVAINQFQGDTEQELRMVRSRMASHGAPAVLTSHWAKGGAGAADLAAVVAEMAAGEPPALHFAYEDSDSLWEKVRAIAEKIYCASDVRGDAKVMARVKELEQGGYGRYPVCIAKTQYSFSTDPALRGAPAGHILDVREVRLSAGAEFVVFVCGDIMTMPGLPKIPAAVKIDLDEHGRITGLF